MSDSVKFKLKEDSSEIEIFESQIEEILPDANALFSLIILKDGAKHFVYGTENEILESFQ